MKWTYRSKLNDAHLYKHIRYGKWNPFGVDKWHWITFDGAIIPLYPNCVFLAQPSSFYHVLSRILTMNLTMCGKLILFRLIHCGLKTPQIDLDLSQHVAR